MATLEEMLAEAEALRAETAGALEAERTLIQQESEAILRAELEAEIARLRAIRDDATSTGPSAHPAAPAPFAPPAPPVDEEI